MARGNKLTITIVEARRNCTISWQGQGTSGSLNLSRESGVLQHAALPRTDTNQHYVTDLLNLVLANLT